MDGSLYPRHRTEQLVQSAFDGELLIQDTRRHRAHALNAQASAVFRLADGSHSVEEIAALASVESGQIVTAEMVWHSLGLLQRLHLLEEPVVTKEDRITRKMLLQGVGAAVALASIASIAVPAAGAHASACLGPGMYCTNATVPCCPSVTCLCTDSAQTLGCIGRHQCI